MVNDLPEGIILERLDDFIIADETFKVVAVRNTSTTAFVPIRLRTLEVMYELTRHYLTKTPEEFTKAKEKWYTRISSYFAEKKK
jgi:hypothetical protein